MDLELRRATVDEILPLRHRVLRTGMPLESAIFPEDHQANVIHYGAFLNGQAIVCFTLLPSEWDGVPTWQLRGMATDKAHQGEGYGSQLIRFAEADVKKSTIGLRFWCNARLTAVPFYERNGWEIASDRFVVPIFGPHHKMIRF
jgi:GNAT superfamily N-acetyltransferase